MIFAVRYRVLGPVEVVGDDGPVALRSASQRLLLALLLAADGAFVTADRLAEDLWGEDQPSGPTGALQTHVSRLRRALPDPASIETGPSGYRVVDPENADRRSFDDLVATAALARQAGDPAAAMAALDEALGLWRGDAFADVADHPSLEAVAAGLDDARVRAEEDRVEVLIDLGRHGPAASAAEALRRAAPLRERPAALAMRALYAGGRHAEALEVYADLRRTLGDELGLEPSDELRELEGRILRHDLEVTPSPAPVAAPVPPTPQHRVPSPRTRLIGREVDVTRVGDALERNRLVTLIGPGGTGKTRLAIELAAGADGAAFVDLTRLDADHDLPRGVAGQLGVEQRTGQSSTERLVEAMHAHDLLLVLDNCEHVLDDIATLVDHLLDGTPRLRILATSREALTAAGEHVVAIAPLDVVSATDLLVERADAAGVTLVRDRRAHQLCALVDNLPLGVELAAARLRSATLDELLSALDEDRDDLQGGSRTSAERHRSLDNLVAWSYDDLEPADQEVLRALSVFAGPARADDVTAVLGRDAASGLRRLVECSLAVRRERHGASRFGLLETVRQFGRRRLEDLGELTRLRAAHTDWALALTTSLPARMQRGGALAALQHMDEVLDDLRQAFRTLFDEGDVARARRLVAPLWSYNLSRVHTEVYGWARQLDDRWPASASDPDPDGIRITGLAAAGDSFGGSLADAIDRGRRAVAADAPPGCLALVYGAMADAQMFSGNPVEAAESYAKAVELSREADEGLVSTYSRAEVAMALAFAEDPTAIAEADAALAELRQRDDPSALAFGLYIAGESRLESDPDAAEPLLEEALAMTRLSGNRLVIGAAGLSHLSITARREPHASLAEFPGLIDHWIRLGLWPQLWTTMRLVVEVLTACGEARAAARLLGAEAASQRSGTLYGADARRRAELWERLEAELGAADLAQLVDEGRALADDAAVEEALEALSRAATG